MSDEADNLKMTVDGQTLVQFLQDWSFVTAIRGPWGSGKSTTAIAKIFQAANLQAPNRNGVRKSRWAIVRESYPELQETTIKTWLEWFPEDLYGPMRRSRPFSHIIRVPGEPVDGKRTVVEMENIFLALGDDEDLKKLLSLELTGAWVNEGIKKALLDAVIGRTGRYPSKRDGGHSWAGVVLDTNSVPESHWLPMMMGESPIPDSIGEDERMSLIRPDDWHYYVQPGALRPVKDDTGKIVDFEPNPDAENINNLTDGFDYYMRRKGGKTRNWVLTYFCNELGTVMAGKPVWPSFDRLKHVSRTRVKYDPHQPLLIGNDSTGRSPAAVIGQRKANRWSILAEIVGRDISTPNFAKALKAKLASVVGQAGLNYHSSIALFYRDPHQEKGQGDDRNTDAMYLQEGIRLIPAPGGNAIRTRLDAVEMLFDNDKIEIDPSCTSLIAACSGGYRFRKMNVSGDVYEEAPDKRNGFADVADALQYLVLGGGGGREMVYGAQPMARPVNVIKPFNPLARRGLATRRVAAAR